MARPGSVQCCDPVDSAGIRLRFLKSREFPLSGRGFGRWLRRFGGWRPSGSAGSRCAPYCSAGCRCEPDCSGGRPSAPYRPAGRRCVPSGSAGRQCEPYRPAGRQCEPEWTAGRACMPDCSAGRADSRLRRFGKFFPKPVGRQPKSSAMHTVFFFPMFVVASVSTGRSGAAARPSSAFFRFGRLCC